jgi:membrane protein
MTEVSRVRPRSLARTTHLARRVAAACHQDRVDGLAAEFAFFGVLSTFPGLLVVAALLGSLERLVGHDLANRSEALVLRTMDQVLTSSAAGLRDAVRELFARPSRGIAILAMATALVGLSRAWAVVIRALDLAFRVEEQRPWLHQRLLGLVLALSSVLLVVLGLGMIVADPLLGAGTELAERLGLGRPFAVAWNWLRWPLGFAALVAWAATVYHVAPGRRFRWREALPGAVAAAVLWLVASGGFSLYVRVAASANRVLGTLGGGLIGVLWLYLLALSLLVGGELNAVLHRDREPGTRVAPPG